MATKKQRGIRSNVKTLALNKNLSGISQNRDERFLNPTEALDILNMHSVKDGTWSADRAGYSRVNAVALESGASIDGVHWFTESDGTDHLLVACNGKLKTIDVDAGTASDVDASAGYTVGNIVDFLNFNGVVFSVDGSIATPRKWDGTTAGNAGGWPVSDGINSFDTPKYAELHQNRSVFSGFADFPDHIVISDQNDGEVFTQPATTAAHSFITAIAPGDGGVITGMRTLPIPNSNDDILVVYKTRGMHAVVGRSGWTGDADAFKVIRINSNFGAFNNRCIVQVGQDLYSLNEFGISSYTSASQSGTFQPVGINVNRVRDVVERINLNVREKCWGIHLVDRREVWFGVPTGSSTVVNEFIVYKYPDPGEPEGIPRWSRRNGFTSGTGAIFDKEFYIGTYDGFVGKMFNSSKYHDVGIPWAYEHAFWDMGNELQIKRILHSRAIFRVRSNQTFTMRTEWKGGGNNDIFSQSLPITTTANGAVYGTAIYGTAVYGVKEEVKVLYNVPGNGEQIKHRLSGTTTTTGPEYLGLALKTEVGGLSSHWN